MTLSDTLTSWRKSLPTILRRLAITLSVALVGALAVGSSWLVHRPVGYSGDAHASSLISPGFASGFDVAWELTAADLGVGGSLRAYEEVDGRLVAFFGGQDQPPTLVGLDLSGEKPSVLWRREVAAVDSPMFAWGNPSWSRDRRSASPTGKSRQPGPHRSPRTLARTSTILIRRPSSTWGATRSIPQTGVLTRDVAGHCRLLPARQA